MELVDHLALIGIHGGFIARWAEVSSVSGFFVIIPLPKETAIGVMSIAMLI